jgi:hypothetical protein
MGVDHCLSDPGAQTGPAAGFSPDRQNTSSFMPIKQAIATKLIALAKAGENNPDILCEEVLKDIRTPQQWAASEAARSLLSDPT